HHADMQFVGQTHVLTVPIARTDFSREELADTFERAYRDRFGVELREMRALVMSLRTAVIAHRRPIALDGLRGAAAPGGAVGTRKVWFETNDVSPDPRRGGLGGAAGAPHSDSHWHDTPIYRRVGLPAGLVLTGPALVEQVAATAVIEAGDHVRVGACGPPQIS